MQRKQLVYTGNPGLCGDVQRNTQCRREGDHLDTYKAQVRKLKELQSKSGLWHTVLTDPDSYEEVSGSAAIVAGILKGIKMGILDDSYLECAWKGVQAILKNIDKDGTVLNVSGGTGMGYDADHYKIF